MVVERSHAETQEKRTMAEDLSRRPAEGDSATPARPRRRRRRRPPVGPLWLATLLLANGVVASGIAAYDAALGATASGGRLLAGGVTMIILGVSLLLMWRRAAGAMRGRLLVLGLGPLPFLLFAWFIIWRIGISADLSEACLQDDDVEACHTLGSVKAKRGRDDDARALLRHGCTLLDARCCLELGGLERRLGSEALALDAYQAACTMQDRIGCFRAGQTALRRDNVPMADVYFAAGCTLGDMNSCQEREALPRELDHEHSGHHHGEHHDDGHPHSDHDHDH